MNYSTRRFYDIPPFIETSPDMKKHICWITVVFCTLVLQVRPRNLQGQWPAGPGFVPGRRMPLLPDSWYRSRIWPSAGLVEERASGPQVSQVVAGEELLERSSLGDARVPAVETVPEDTSGLAATPPDISATTHESRSEPVAGALKGANADEHPVTRKASVMSDIYFVALVAGCSAVAVFGVVAAGYCFYKVQKNARAAADVDYPAYGVTGPNKESVSPTADRKLAQSAQMYHFQHQKQQMIAVEKNNTNRHTSASDVDTEEEENEEGDYTVYECPGMASGGELEVKNPLFQEDPIVPPAEAGKADKSP